MNDLSSHGIVVLINNGNDEYLLLEDARELMRGYWAPPHGRCEPTDADEKAAVIREVKEETSLTVKPLRKLHTQSADTKVQTVSFWLAETSEGDVKLDAESSAYGWFTLHKAKELILYPGTRSFIDLVEAGEISLN